MADSGSEKAGSDVDDDPDEPGFDPAADPNKMSDKDQRKMKKNLDKWKIFSNFLFRHIAIATFKYNCFECEDLNAFLVALDRAEALRSTQKLKKGEEPRISSLKTMKEGAELLDANKFEAEADVIRRYLDVSGRLKGIALIAGGYYKALKKGKVKHLDKMKYYIDFWKGFCVRSFDYSTLGYSNCDPESFNDLERRFLAWPLTVRTSLNLSQRFMKKTSEATGIPLLSEDPKVLQQHMQAAEFVIATKIEDMLFRKVVGDAKSFLLGAPLGSSLQGVGGKSEKWDLPDVDDVDPAMLKPVPDSGMLMALPEEPPKEKKGKKGKGKKGKKSASAKRRKK